MLYHADVWYNYCETAADYCLLCARLGLKCVVWWTCGFLSQ